MGGDAEVIREMMRKSTARRKLFDKEKPEPAGEAPHTEEAQTADAEKVQK